jgi:hypothetical protein
MMTDIYGEEHHTVGDYICHPEWIKYSKKFSAWGKAITSKQWDMMQAEENVKKSTPRGQLILPLFPNWDRPEKPTVPVNILKRTNQLMYL